MADPDSSAVQNEQSKEGSPPEKLHQHHVSKILDEVLEETAPSETPQRFRHPMFVDLGLGVGLLIALAGFAAGLMRMYIAHSAEQSIIKNNYKAAIAILKGTPLPSFFEPPGSEPRELLDKAYYLDAMEKLSAYSEDQSALKELESIEAGSPFFDLAQTILKEHFKPSAITLQGGAEHTEQITPGQATEHQEDVPQPPQDNSP
ncbi:MAG: hypothetical protein C5B53_11675 [Candidatus Melainabacteria bacterium]|nr:MAG: hypothetical protein C5B53_11675 [Candidatus Melainabacteria bacterium]